MTKAAKAKRRASPPNTSNRPDAVAGTYRVRLVRPAPADWVPEDFRDQPPWIEETIAYLFERVSHDFAERKAIEINETTCADVPPGYWAIVTEEHDLFERKQCPSCGRLMCE